MNIRIEELSLTEKLKLLSQIAASLVEKFKAEEFSVQMARNEANAIVAQKERLLEELETVKAAVKDNKEEVQNIIKNAEKKASKILEDATHIRELSIIANEEAKKTLLQAKEEAKNIVAETKSQIRGK